MPLTKDLTLGHSWSTYWKHSIQCHVYSYSQNLWTLDVSQTWLLGFTTTLMIGPKESLLVMRSQSGTQFPEDSHKAPASVPFCSISVRKLPQKFISDTFQFADDTTLVEAHPSLEVVTSILTVSFNCITTPIHCMYISDTIWVQCIPLCTQNCINKHGHSLLVYFSHNMATIHTMWVFLDWMLSQSADRYMNAW